MSRKIILILAASVLLGLSLAACGASSTPTPTALPSPTVSSAPASTAPLQGVHTYLVIPDESEAAYVVKEEFFEGALAKLGIKAGQTEVIGKTQDIEGQIQIDFDNLSAPLQETFITVNISSLKTDQSRRDNWIQDKGPRLASYPLAKFQAKAIENAPASYREGEEVQFQLLGDLTIREITKEVSFDVTATIRGNTLSGVATTSLLMSDFGIEPPSFANTLTVQDAFELRIKITARE